MQTKVCSKCGKELPLKDFYADGKASDKRQSICKACKQKAYRIRKAQRAEDAIELRREALASAKSKLCPACGRWLPLTYFYKADTGKFGFSSHCKQCQQIAARLRRERQAEREANSKQLLQNCDSSDMIIVQDNTAK